MRAWVEDVFVVVAVRGLGRGGERRRSYPRPARALQRRPERAGVDQVAVLQPGLSDAVLQKLADYFELARDLTVQISNVDVLR